MAASMYLKANTRCHNQSRSIRRAEPVSEGFTKLHSAMSVLYRHLPQLDAVMPAAHTVERGTSLKGYIAHGKIHLSAYTLSLVQSSKFTHSNLAKVGKSVCSGVTRSINFVFAGKAPMRKRSLHVTV